jgi:hypothetical protein
LQQSLLTKAILKGRESWPMDGALLDSSFLLQAGWWKWEKAFFPAEAK